ncbi:penicillin-binding protein 2 [Streptacidiphilus sp. PB12-B1b]|uniref:peptidoglycan D,D-transpeptidase FtsI family protein n=1 Tax=Streptacidiphilus sp. PB12-B1b TaxID=2705012 RepID=UPI0015F7D6A2|nr:penicillin-binding protein 2 [Streptacidiphilus sp. PB12-B1b]QMU74432.1 penicillin-binding protein 2 [Streptacidiphilus sp. PB12-B1b]
MNKPIRRVSVFCLVLVLALMIRVNWVQGVDASALNNNTNNQRGMIEAYSYPRGSIIVGGQAVTKSVLVNGNRFKYQESFTNGPLYAPVTGYSSPIFGSLKYDSNLLESVEDPILSGTAPELAVNNFESLITGKAKQGGDVVTTIDPKVQLAGYQGLSSKKYTGAAVALDPTTGAILGLVSTPSYDPNSFANGADYPAYQKLLSDPSNPMLNRALRQTYPPGSTFKLITSAAALETGKITDINAPTDSPSPYLLPGTDTYLPNESASDPCKDAPMTIALQYSCNTVFAKLGAEVGNARMLQEADKFGFNAARDMPVGVVPSVFPSGVNASGNALSSIGQFDTTATPLQMAMVAAAICNNGSLMTPYLVSELRAPDQSVVGTPHQATQLSQATTPQVASEIQTMMQAVVQGGTGVTAQIPGVTVGGKTGTAQNGVNNSGNPYAWFVSYAKNSAGKEIAVAVVVANSSTERGDISGEELAAPIAKQMMEAYVGS